MIFPYFYLCKFVKTEWEKNKDLIKNHVIKNKIILVMTPKYNKQIIKDNFIIDHSKNLSGV